MIPKYSSDQSGKKRFSNYKKLRSLSSNLNEWEEESLKFNYATNEDDIGKNGTD